MKIPEITDHGDHIIGKFELSRETMEPIIEKHLGALSPDDQATALITMGAIITVLSNGHAPVEEDLFSVALRLAADTLDAMRPKLRDAKMLAMMTSKAGSC